MRIVEYVTNWFKPTAHALNEVIPIKIEELSPETLKQDLSQKLKDFQSDNKYTSIAALANIYTKVENSRTSLIKSVNEIRQFYLADVIISQYVDDALAPDTITGDIISVTSRNPQVETELKYLDRKFRFDRICGDVAPELVAYGEYTLKTVLEEGKGMTDLLDNVDQDLVIAIPNHGEIDGYIIKKSGIGGYINTYELMPPKAYVKFLFSSQRLRVPLNKEFVDTAISRANLAALPTYIRVGKSLIFPAIPKIKELELLEQLVPATKLSKLAQGTVIGVQVPGGYGSQLAIEFVRNVENLLNRKLGVDQDQRRLTLENIWSAAGSIKCVPLFGDKGQIQKFDYKQDEPDDLLSNINDLRRVICSSVGLPYELIFGSDSEAGKGNILKRYARYLRKLKSLQGALAEGVRQIIYIHLANKGVSFTPDDINIEFRNKLVEIDALDKLEFIDTTIGTLKNLGDWITGFDAKYADKIDFDQLFKYIGDTLTVVGVEHLMKDTGTTEVSDDMKRKALVTKLMQAHQASSTEEPSSPETPPEEAPSPKEAPVEKPSTESPTQAP